jgi:hypothetical protein
MRFERLSDPVSHPARLQLDGYKSPLVVSYGNLQRFGMGKVAKLNSLREISILMLWQEKRREEPESRTEKVPTGR